MKKEMSITEMVTKTRLKYRLNSCTEAVRIDIQFDNHSTIAAGVDHIIIIIIIIIFSQLQLAS